MTTPSERRDTAQVLVRRGVSQRKALRYLGVIRRIAGYAPCQAGKDRVVAERLLAASPKVPRFGYRRMAAWLDLGEARERRLWRQLGLNIPRRLRSAATSSCTVQCDAPQRRLERRLRPRPDGRRTHPEDAVRDR